jgi:hypothetical protein
MQMTLWEMLKPLLGLRPAPPQRRWMNRQEMEDGVPVPLPAVIAPVPRRRAAAKRTPAAPVGPTQRRYDEVVDQMLARYEVRVRKWRTQMTGVAWYVTYRDGRISRLIEAPRPKGPMSMAVFLHEIGHHAIGFDVYKPRCLEEYHAWRFALETMQELGLNITDGVRLRVHQSLHYAIAKAQRRGLRALPPELEPYTVRPPRRRCRRSPDR